MRTLQCVALGLGCALAVPALAADGDVAADDWFFLPYPENSNSQHGMIKVGKMRDEPPEYPGTKVFWIDAENTKYAARTFFKTRIATPQELTLGRRVIYPVGSGWGYRRIVNLVDAPKGQLIVDGNSDPIVERKGLRVIVGGEPDPTIAMSGKEDAHGFHPEHWLVFTEKRDPDADGVDTKMALAIRAPAKPGDAGVFLVLASGEILTTKHAYRTRVATKAALKSGARVAIFESGSEAPSRDLAYCNTWWIGNVTTVTASYIKVGNRSVPVDIMRIVE